MEERMPKFTFNELVGALMGLLGLAAIVYASIFQGSEGAMTALVGVLNLAGGYFLRGKLERPGEQR